MSINAWFAFHGAHHDLALVIRNVHMYESCTSVQWGTASSPREEPDFDFEKRDPPEAGGRSICICFYGSRDHMVLLDPSAAVVGLMPTTHVLQKNCPQ